MAKKRLESLANKQRSRVSVQLLKSVDGKALKLPDWRQPPVILNPEGM